MKTTQRSFGFLYEDKFVSGTLLQKENGLLDAFIFTDGQEYESISIWKPDGEDQKKFHEAAMKLLRNVR